MKKSNVTKILKKYFAIAAIYLIISLTFFTARAIAVLNYDISGENYISGYARRTGDIIHIDVDADSNVSFITTTGSYNEIPLDTCNGNYATPGGVNCFYLFKKSDINTNINTVQFMLQQSDGDPFSTTGNLYVDGMAPVKNKLNVTKNGSGLMFKYDFTDYLASTSETVSDNTCLGVGIGHIEFRVQGKIVYMDDFPDKNCTISGERFIDFSNNYNDKTIYSVIVRDRVWNEFNTGPLEIGGDFRAPIITGTFKIMQDLNELKTLSSSVEITADIVVQVEDSNLSTLEGDMSNLHVNPAVSLNPAYAHVPAACNRESGNLWTCRFSDVRIQPGSTDMKIMLTATDMDGNVAKKEAKNVVTMKDSAGSVLYLGPLKTHCTADLSSCYLRTGPQLLQVELDTTSSYNNTIIHLGANSDNRFALCKLEGVWRCTGPYNVPADITSIDLVLAESYDDYGNMIESDMQRIILIDNDPPTNISEVTSVNNNNNNACSVAGDTLTLSLRVKDVSPEIKIYVDTSKFTTQQVQKGSCTAGADNTWDCTLIVKDFSSVPATVPQNITIEDLAGNKLPIPYQFDVCKGASNIVPNVIYGIAQDKNNIPNIDRRTASKIAVKTYIPLIFDVQNGTMPATLMYLNIERCVAKGENGGDVMGSGHTLIPRYGSNPVLVLNIGNNGAQLPENELKINCTISARVRVGPTVYLQEEKQEVILTVNTFNNPLGGIDKATNDEMNLVRKHLRDLDKEIENREGFDKILGGICRLAETIGKSNSILQAAKAVLYGVFIVLANIPAISAEVMTLWTTVQTTMGQIHGYVTQYVWPPGMLSVSIGGGVKLVCSVYTCKHLDIGTYLGLATELSSNAIGKLGADLLDGSSSTDGPPPAVQSGAGTSGATATSGPTATETQVFVQDGGEGHWESTTGTSSSTSTPTAVSGTGGGSGTKDSPIMLGGVNVDGGERTKMRQLSPTLGVSFPDDVLNKAYTLKAPPTYKTPEVQGFLKDNTKYMSDALNGHQWIVNPYKSIHYDDTCNPAIIYNLKKDKQISCMYLNCLQNQVNYGLPKIICDGNYRINKCLYLDSAEYVLNGRGSAFKALMSGLKDALKASALGMTIQLTYTFFCASDYVPQGHLQDTLLQTGGWHSAICGVAGSGLALKEIIDFAKSPFSEMKTMDPSEKKNFCSGLDYSEGTDIGSEAGYGYFDE